MQTMNSKYRLGVLLVASLFLLLSSTLPAQQVPSNQQQPVNPQQPDPPALPQEIPPRFSGDVLMNHRQSFFAEVRGNRPDAIYAAGEKLSIEFLADEEAYLYFLYHDVAGTSQLLFPNQAELRNQIPAKTIVTLPPPGNRFRFRIRAPFGSEWLQVVASRQPIPELDQIAQTAGESPVVAPELIARLATRLQQDPTQWAEHRQQIQTVPKEDPPAKRKPDRIGLFIGAGKDLRDPKMHDIHMGNSAKLFRQAMIDKGKIDPKRAMLILDEQATYDAFEKAIVGWLPEVSQPGDEVFIFIACHSGQTPNLDGSEPDGIDEGLAPYDLQASTEEMSPAEREQNWRNSLVLDDTIARWLQELYGRRVVLIVDSCLAGGLTDAKTLPNFKLNFLADEANRLKDISQLNLTILTSTMADEQALFEGTPNETMWFSHFLIQAVEETENRLTVQDAFAAIRVVMREIVRKLGAAMAQQPTLTENNLIPVWLVP